MSMRCRSHLARLLPLLIVALALMLALPDAAGAAPAAGTAVEVVIPGEVSLFAFCAAALVLLGLAVARHRPTV
ncbi:MAG: hypothetical protein M3Q03_03955 [Chloroflexota bacterium]|nr:hypothetical protein [Chloroflexota bacterium]